MKLKNKKKGTQPGLGIIRKQYVLCSQPCRCACWNKGNGSSTTANKATN